jgi:hypothetical protein
MGFLPCAALCVKADVSALGCHCSWENALTIDQSGESPLSLPPQAIDGSVASGWPTLLVVLESSGAHLASRDPSLLQSLMLLDFRTGGPYSRLIPRTHNAIGRRFGSFGSFWVRTLSLLSQKPLTFLSGPSQFSNIFQLLTYSLDALVN